MPISTTTSTTSSTTTSSLTGKLDYLSSYLGYYQGMVDALGTAFVPRGGSGKAQALKGTVARFDGSTTYGTIAGLLTTDTITAAAGGIVPTCTVNGRLDGVAGDSWDVKIHRAGVLFADLAMTSLGSSTEHSSTLGLPDCAFTSAGDVITEVSDGTGSDRLNVTGYSSRENLLTYSEDLTNADWSKINGATTPNTETVVFAAVANSKIVQKVTANPSLASEVGDAWYAIFQARNNTTATGANVFIEENGSPFEYSNVIISNNTNEWQDYSVPVYVFPNNGNTAIQLNIVNQSSEAGQVEIRNINVSKNKTSDYIATTDTAITGRQPAGFQSLTTENLGPLSRSLVFAEKGCIDGDGTGYASIPGLLTTDVITALSTSVPTCTIDGRMDFATGESFSGVTVTRSSVIWAYYPCENGNPDITLPVDLTGIVWLQDTENENNGTLVDFLGDPYGTCTVSATNPSEAAIRGFSLSHVDSTELFVDPDVTTTDGSNYSTYDSETGIGRIVSDGGSVTLAVVGVLEVGKSYQADYTPVTIASGTIYLLSADDNHVFDSSAETFDFIADSVNLIVKRSGACDITFQLSTKQKFPGVTLAEAGLMPDGSVPDILPGTGAMINSCPVTGAFVDPLSMQIPGLTNMTEIYIPTYTPDTYVRIGSKGMLTYYPALSAAEIVQVDNYLGV